MDEGGGAPAKAGGGPPTVEVPSSAIGPAKVGDTVQMRVISIDAQSGMANLSPVMPSADEPDKSGTQEMADEFGPDKSDLKGPNG